MASTRKAEITFFLVLTGGALLVSFFIFKPYISALFVAVVFALVFNPLYEWILGKTGGRKNLSSILTLFLLFVIVLIPITIFGFFMFDDARNLYSSLRDGAGTVSQIENWSRPIESKIQRFMPDAEFDLSSYITNGLQYLVGNLGSLFTRLVDLGFKVFIMFLALFYLFRDGVGLRQFVVKLSPLTNEYDEKILKRLEDAISSVVKGRLIIVIVQGILTSLGLFLFGIPHAVLWGAVTSIAALIPAVGVALVFIPLVAYVFYTGSLGMAIGILVFSILVGAIDNLLGPILFERGLKIHPMLILLSVLGGLAFFGPIGFLAGPVALSLLFALMDIYPLLLESDRVESNSAR